MWVSVSGLVVVDVDSPGRDKKELQGSGGEGRGESCASRDVMGLDMELCQNCLALVHHSSPTQGVNTHNTNLLPNISQASLLVKFCCILHLLGS